MHNMNIHYHGYIVIRDFKIFSVLWHTRIISFSNIIHVNINLNMRSKIVENTLAGLFTSSGVVSLFCTIYLI